MACLSCCGGAPGGRRLKNAPQRNALQGRLLHPIGTAGLGRPAHLSSFGRSGSRNISPMHAANTAASPTSMSSSARVGSG
jgi:hypothetical protein